MDRRTRELMEDMAVGPYIVPSVMNPSKARGIAGMLLALKGRLFRLMEDMTDVLEGRYMQSDPELVELAKKVTLAYENGFKPALLALEARAKEKARDKPKSEAAPSGVTKGWGRMVVGAQRLAKKVEEHRDRVTEIASYVQGYLQTLEHPGDETSEDPEERYHYLEQAQDYLDDGIERLRASLRAIETAYQDARQLARTQIKSPPEKLGHALRM